MARLGHALSDETRTRALLALTEAPANSAEIAEALGVTRQKMSNHLACLRGCGLVVATKVGRHTSYSLSDPHLAEALHSLLQVTLTVDPQCCSGEECSCS